MLAPFLEQGRIQDELTHVHMLHKNDWTLVTYKKKGWNNAKNINYVNTGDTYNEPRFKHYSSLDFNYPAEIELEPNEDPQLTN